jgi:CcmD family protein
MPVPSRALAAPLSALAGLVVATMLLFAPLASAQEQVDPAEERSATFRAVEGPQTEDVPGGALLVAAYAVVWTLVLLYVLRLGRSQDKLGRDVERLERSLAAGDGASKD